MSYPDPFYPVIDSLKWLQCLTKLGVGSVQLRAKTLAFADALTLVRDALRITKGTGTKLVVNDYWQAAIDARADHVHLGQEDLAEADVAAIRRAGLTLGLSTHDDEELANALKHNPDYIALGPIYETTLKKMRFAPQGVSRVTEWKKRIGKIPLVAIGGITLERAAAIYLAGADSIAVVTDITQNPNPESRVRAWLGQTSKAA
jgi:thiamine-phosphate pyrophosphorylase